MGWDAWTAGALLTLSILFAGAVGSEYWLQVFHLVGIYSVVAILNNVLLGDAGQVSFGQGAVLGVGAYGTAVALSLWGVPFAVAALVGILCGALLGALFALPALRVEGYYLGFVTLAAAVAFSDAIHMFPGITGGIRGIAAPVPSLRQPVFMSLTLLSLLVLLLGLAAVVLHARLRKIDLGRQMIVAKTSPEAAATLGISAGRVRALSFIISGAVTGLAGALYVPLLGYVGTDAFELDLSIFFFFVVIAGGVGYASGSVVGVALLHIVPQVLLASYVEYRLLIYGATTFLIMLLMPDGVVGTAAKVFTGRPREGRADDVVGSLQRLLQNDDAKVGGVRS